MISKLSRYLKLPVGVIAGLAGLAPAPVFAETAGGLTQLALPWAGTVDLSELSLGLLSVVGGVLDGFNVCSLGSLFLILSLVMTLQSRRLIAIFGGLFILTTAVVYGLLMFLWYQLWSYLLPYQELMRVIVSVLALGGSILFFRQFLRARRSGPVCESSDGRIVNAATQRIQAMFQSGRGLPVLIIGVLVFAGLVTVIEFPCSAAVPGAFTAVLAQAELSWPVALFYTALFLIFYMLDEIVVVAVVVATRRFWSASPAVVTWMNLAGAIVLLLMAGYFIF